MKWTRSALILAVTLAFTRPAAAHPVPFSYLDLKIGERTIEVSLVAHIFDLAHDLQIVPIEQLLNPGVVAGRAEAMRALFRPRLEISADGRPLEAEWSAPEVLRDRQSLRFRL